MHWASIRGDTGTRMLLRLNLKWLDKISTVSSGNYGHANSASTTNQRLSRLKMVRDSPLSKTACVKRWKDHFNDLLKEALYRIWCGVNRLGNSSVNRLGDTSAFVNTAGQLLLTRRGKTRMDGVGIVFEFYTAPEPLFNKPCDATDAKLQRDAEQATPNVDSPTDLVTSCEVELCLMKASQK